MTLSDLDRRIRPWCGLDRTDSAGHRVRTTTRSVRIARGIIGEIPDALLSVGSVDIQRPVIVCDPNTRRVAADALLNVFQGVRPDTTLLCLEPVGGADVLLCDDHLVAQVVHGAREHGATHLIAVGSGTLNDAVKAAGLLLGVSCSVLATAPSMNGYTSAIAAVLSDGVKTTRPSAAPIAVFADPDILAAAPYRMIASGIGDLYSKPVSNADWRLSARLLDTTHSSIVMEIVEAGHGLLDGVAAALPSRDPDAIARLTGALMLSGLAMQAAGTSGPASGGEHLISHYIDMTAHAFGQSHDFHGCQVAVGTLVTSRLYEHVRRLDPRSIDVDTCVARHLTKEAMAARISRRFGPLAEAVIPHAHRAWTDRVALRRRLERLLDQWSELWDDVSTTLRPADLLEAELRSAQCPTRFAEIGVDPARAWRAVVHSRDIRARYTILHLADELGVLEGFAASYPDCAQDRSNP